MELLYFDFDHGTERLLWMRLDRAAHTVHFRFEQSPDPTYDEQHDVATVTVNAATTCSSDEQLLGFWRALVRAMRHTPYSLQHPGKRPFEAMPHDALTLDDLGPGVQARELTCHAPEEIVVAIVSSNELRARFRSLA
ncbi:MAG: hypothetical protein H0T42_27325 [Deltaproteobacteria bacterium]|nr:hypothetical protein [Deltaproteobacteria bacterium]